MAARRFDLVWGGLGLAAACVDHPLVGNSMDHATEVVASSCIPDPPKVDVLLIIDDSPSMGQESETLAANLRSFMHVYEQSLRILDYRIAVTTTSVSVPHCTGTASDGRLVDTPCQNRLDDFVAAPSHESDALDLQSVCLDTCRLTKLPLQNTFVAGEKLPRPRPWLQRERGRHNYPDDVDPGDMLACMGLVGVGGCVYESPLEAAARALRRMQDETDPSFGFMRNDAALFVLFIGDEDDCSARPEHAQMFDPDGDRAFWEGNEPSSAICWNAATACGGGPGTYDDCGAADWTPKRQLGGPEDAVLHPVDKYIELLQQIEDHKQSRTGFRTQRVFTSAVAGVPQGYISGQDIVYQDSQDPNFQSAFGIGVGCSSVAGEATPPARIRAITESFHEFDRGMVSTCGTNWTRALACVPGGPPRVDRCIRGCVRDMDRTTSRLEPDCTLTQGPSNGVGTGPPIPTCIPDAKRGWGFPTGADACVRWLVDAAGETASLADDMSLDCVDDGSNLEYIIERTVGLWEGQCLHVTCQVSNQPELDCPNLG